MTDANVTQKSNNTRHRWLRSHSTQKKKNKSQRQQDTASFYKNNTFKIIHQQCVLTLNPRRIAFSRRATQRHEHHHQ